MPVLLKIQVRYAYDKFFMNSNDYATYAYEKEILFIDGKALWIKKVYKKDGITTIEIEE